MTTYVIRDGELVEKDKAAPLSAAPFMLGDIAGYQSPITGHWIEGRRARRYDLERHNCVPSGGSDRPSGPRSAFAREWRD